MIGKPLSRLGEKVERRIHADRKKLLNFVVVEGRARKEPAEAQATGPRP